MITLSMAAIGAPKNPILSIYPSFQDPSHNGRTPYRDSMKPNRKYRDVPLQIIGQSNGCGGPAYVAISAVIIELKKAMRFGFTWFALSLFLLFISCVFLWMTPM
jgi:hypothetical protein